MFTVFSPCSCPISLTRTLGGSLGMSKMNARLVAVVLAALGLGALGDQAFAQNYAPPPPPGYRGPPVIANDDDDLVPLPGPGPYGRPSGAPYPYDPQSRPPGTIQRDA